MAEERHWVKSTISYQGGPVIVHQPHHGYRTAQDALAEVAARRARHKPKIEGLTITWTEQRTGTTFRLEYEEDAA